MLVRELGKIMAVRPAPSKAEDPMLVMLEGRVMLVRVVALAKAP